MMSSVRSPGFARQHLKAATADRHDRLDSGFAALDLKKPNDYRYFLAAQAAVFGPLEGWLTNQGIADLLPDWPERRRFDALAADLAGLGTPAGDDGDLPGFGQATAPQLLGVAYVLEGSRLGAHHLARDVAGSDDLAVRGNMRFLTHGSGRRLWPAFLEALESGVHAGSAETAADAARHTFDLFIAAQRRQAPALAEAGA